MYNTWPSMDIHGLIVNGQSWIMHDPCISMVSMDIHGVCIDVCDPDHSSPPLTVRLKCADSSSTFVRLLVELVNVRTKFLKVRWSQLVSIVGTCWCAEQIKVWMGVQ